MSRSADGPGPRPGTLKFLTALTVAAAGSGRRY